MSILKLINSYKILPPSYEVISIEESIIETIICHIKSLSLNWLIVEIDINGYMELTYFSNSNTVTYKINTILDNLKNRFFILEATELSMIKKNQGIFHIDKTQNGICIKVEDEFHHYKNSTKVFFLLYKEYKSLKKTVESFEISTRMSFDISDHNNLEDLFINEFSTHTFNDILHIDFEGASLFLDKKTLDRINFKEIDVFEFEIDVKRPTLKLHSKDYTIYIPTLGLEYAKNEYKKQKGA